MTRKRMLLDANGSRDERNKDPTNVILLDKELYLKFRKKEKKTYFVIFLNENVI